MGCLFIAPYEECEDGEGRGWDPKHFLLSMPLQGGGEAGSSIISLRRGKGGVDGFLPCVPVRGGVLELDFKRSGVT